VTIDLETTNESFIVVPIDLSGFKDFGVSPSEFQQMVQSGRATGTVKQGEYCKERF
jgi:hypothetical protein